jgi:hypothetical protein
MENEKPLGQFQEVAKKIQEARDHAREEQEKYAEVRRKRAVEEAVRVLFDDA